MNPLSAPQVQMIRHALGLDWKAVPYRNRYHAAPVDVPAWDDLVAKGFAVLMSRGVHAVTDAGAVALGIDPELLRDS